MSGKVSVFTVLVHDDIFVCHITKNKEHSKYAHQIFVSESSPQFSISNIHQTPLGDSLYNLTCEVNFRGNVIPSIQWRRDEDPI